MISYRSLLALPFICYCQLLRAQPANVNMRLLQDYYMINTTALQPGLNFNVITSRKQFVKLFGPLQKADTPDFSKETVLLMAMPPEHKEPKLVFEQIAVKAGSFLEVYCTIKGGKEPVSYLTYPIAIGVIPTFPELTRIDFYNRQGMQLLQHVEIKRKKGE